MRPSFGESNPRMPQRQTPTACQRLQMRTPGLLGADVEEQVHYRTIPSVTGLIDPREAMNLAK